jgi:hypothetical protein
VLLLCCRPGSQGELGSFATGGEEGAEPNNGDKGGEGGGKLDEPAALALPDAEKALAGGGGGTAAAFEGNCDGDVSKSSGVLPSPIKSPLARSTHMADGFAVRVATAGQIGVPRGVESAAREGWLKVRILTLYNNSIADAACIVLAKALGGNSTIMSLSLRCNRVGDLGLQAISLALAHNQALATLDLSMNEIGDAGTRGLAGVYECVYVCLYVRACVFVVPIS